MTDLQILGFLDERLAQVNREFPSQVNSEFPFDSIAEYMRQGRLAAYEDIKAYILIEGTVSGG